jgi:CheY-like chemotaxis protein
VLKDINVELQLVSNGVEAVAAFQAFSFDVVLMDVQMPEMGGIDATRAIRTYEAGCGRARTPIIALSANAMADHIAEYRAAGMDGHLEKPIDIKQLYAALANLPAPGPTDLQLTA